MQHPLTIVKSWDFSRPRFFIRDKPLGRLEKTLARSSFHGFPAGELTTNFWIFAADGYSCTDLFGRPDSLISSFCIEAFSLKLSFPLRGGRSKQIESVLRHKDRKCDEDIWGFSFLVLDDLLKLFFDMGHWPGVIIMTWARGPTSTNIN
jgi:hypothetical protein